MLSELHAHAHTVAKSTEHAPSNHSSNQSIRYKVTQQKSLHTFCDIHTCTYVRRFSGWKVNGSATHIYLTLTLTTTTASLYTYIRTWLTNEYSQGWHIACTVHALVHTILKYTDISNYQLSGVRGRYLMYCQAGVRWHSRTFTVHPHRGGLLTVAQ